MQYNRGWNILMRVSKLFPHGAAPCMRRVNNPHHVIYTSVLTPLFSSTADKQPKQEEIM